MAKNSVQIGRNKMKDLLLVFFSVLLTTVGQMLLKQGMLKIGKITVNSTELPAMVFRSVINPFVATGLVMYGLATMWWLVVLSRVDLSFAYPMISMGYVLVVFFSWLLFKEEVSLVRILGVIVVCFGVFLISRS